jgi:hypothetical protein
MRVKRGHVWKVLRMVCPCHVASVQWLLIEESNWHFHAKTVHSLMYIYIYFKGFGSNIISEWLWEDEHGLLFICILSESTWSSENQAIWSYNLISIPSFLYFIWNNLIHIYRTAVSKSQMKCNFLLKCE